MLKMQTMLKWTALLSLLLISWQFAKSQASYSYYRAGNGEKVWLQSDAGSLHIQFKHNTDAKSLIAEGNQVSLRASKQKVKDWAILNITEQASVDAENWLQRLNIHPSQVKSVAYGFKNDYGTPLWLTHKIVYAPHPEHFDNEIFEAILSGYEGVEIRRTYSGLPFLEVQKIADVLPLANELAESGLMLWAQPNFKLPVRLMGTPVFPGDSLFNKQFYLHNTGQNPLADLGFGLSGTVDVDIDAPQAWSITMGDSNIVVAVIDEGVEAHEDLENDATGTSRVLPGYTVSDPINGDGSPEVLEDAHGQAVAGIIAASHNTVGVAGIAPNVKILPIHVFPDSVNDVLQFAEAISYAWKNGADIINNSWTFSDCTIPSDSIHMALQAVIDSAVTYGRNGKGCPVFFSAGQGIYPNPGGSCVTYPGNLPQVIAVGAIDNRGKKPNYTNFGDSLDIVAPSSTNDPVNVTVIDRMGALGYNNPGDDTLSLDYPNTNYTRWFGGTSVSCAIASGVAALMLSYDSTITVSQLTDIMISTAKDTGAAGYDNIYGYGIINANDALNSLVSFPVELLAFDARPEDRDVRLSWITASELNNDYFAIERSADGKIFTEIGRVGGAGNSQTTLSYSWLDEQAISGNSWYRLKQVDFDGTASWSAVEEVYLPWTGNLALSPPVPNPARTHISLLVLGGRDQEISLELIDLAGKRLWKKQWQALSDQENIELSVSHLPVGMYIVVLSGSQGIAKSERLVVQK